MQTVEAIYEYLRELAPLELQMDFDNAGFLVGHSKAQVSRVLLALDVTSQVAGEAAECGCQMIVSHHPVIFEAIKELTDRTATGAALLLLAEERIAVVSMHTNLDIAPGGVNDVLLAALGAELSGELEDGCGRVGFLREEQGMAQFLTLCKEALDTDGLRYYDSGRPARHIAVMGGSGGSSVRTAFDKGCDTYVTSDIKYHQFLEAKELGMNLIDGDHYGTENLVIPALCDKLSAHFPDVEFIVSGRHRRVVSFC